MYIGLSIILQESCTTETGGTIDVGNVYKLDVSSSRGPSNSVNRGVPLIVTCGFSYLNTQRLLDVLISLKRTNRSPKDT